MIKNVAVIGSSGAIGNSISKLLKSEISVESVYNFSRSAISESSEKEKNIYIDIENEDSIIESIKKIPKDIKFDLIFVATGILHNELRTSQACAPGARNAMEGVRVSTAVCRGLRALL